MGKPTGFMEFDRMQKPELEASVRIKDFNDFHLPFDIEIQKQQASRCMNCGVPFCQSAMVVNNRKVGCPLSNLIPEWNHLIYLGLYEEAYKRLEKTAPFPEFTGHVCPALCEACCSCSINGDAVGVRANELFLIDKAFENGWIKPKKNIKRNGTSVAVIGSGPAGLACAKALNEKGFTVTVYEKADRFGGLLMYGIPNMKIEKSVVERRIKLLSDEGITFVANTKIGYDIKMEELYSKFDNVVFACGTSLARGLNLENSNNKNVLMAVDFLTATTKNVLDKTPFTYDMKGKKVIVVGGGDTANDCVGTLCRMDAAAVYDLEIAPEPPMNNTLPWPNYPNKKKTDYGMEEAICKYGSDVRRFSTTIDQIVVENDQIKGCYVKNVKFENGKFVDIPDTKSFIECDNIILAMGFIGTSDEDVNAYNMKAIRNRITLNDFNYDDKTFVCGDMKNGQSLVVVAIKDGIDCAQKIIEKYN